jgi:hypothetical protein
VFSILFDGIIFIMCSPSIEKFGASPANIQWTVVRGDTAEFRVDFFENDEITLFDTDGWSYVATAYDPAGDILDQLDIEAEDGYVVIKAPSSVTENWGNAYKNVVAELIFDLQVTIPASVGESSDTIWTPVIGRICVLGDVSFGSGL